VSVDGVVPGQTPIRDLSRRIGTVFQNPETQIFMLRVQEDVAFGCENLALPATDTNCRVEKAMSRMSLSALRNREVYKLSGGQKQRLAIAGALAMGCRTLLLDEPTSDLDEAGRADLLTALSELHRAGHTIVMTEHRLEGLSGIVDRIITMVEGQVVHNGHCPSACLPNRKRQTGDQNAEILVDAKGVDFAYAGQEQLLKEVTFCLRRGEVVALTGPNGSGKTTVLKLLCGLLKPAAGRFVIAGNTRPSLKSLVGTVGFLFQNPDEQLFTDSVAEEIAFGAENLGRPIDLDYYLDGAGLTRYKRAHPLTLSRGERQRLAAAAVLAMEPKVMLLDEPTTGLDQAAWTTLMDMIVRQARRSGACVLFSTHHFETVAAFADRVLTISDRRLVDGRLP
jgi:energy-coupling factor transporter ATP-binding protein EcfA2